MKRTHPETDAAKSSRPDNTSEDACDRQDTEVRVWLTAFPGGKPVYKRLATVEEARDYIAGVQGRPKPPMIIGVEQRHVTPWQPIALDR